MLSWLPLELKTGEGARQALSIGPLTFDPEQWHARGFMVRQAFHGFAVLSVYVLLVILVLFHSWTKSPLPSNQANILWQNQLPI